MKTAKKVLALFLAAAMMFALCACGAKPAEQTAPAEEAKVEAAEEAPAEEAAAEEGPVSGEFSGSAQGMGGQVTVTLTLTDGVITDCVAEGAGETVGIGSVVLDRFPQQVIDNNSIEIDTLSGATITSTAFRTAAALALESAGLNPEDFKGAAEAAAEEVPAEDDAAVYEADVVVVGAGGAGMTAAIAATDLGKKVIIVESQSMVGGNSIRSTGGMNAAVTEWQDTNEFGEAAGVEAMLKSAEGYADNEFITELAATVKEQWAAYQENPEGYFDSTELMELDTMIGGHGINDPELVKTLCESGPDAIEWLDTIGATLHNVGAFGGASVKRIHRPVNAEGKTVSVGAYVVPILEQNCKDRGIEILFDTTANEIVLDENGTAVGVSATAADGSKVVVNADAVVLATGGFGGNMDMVVKYNPSLEGFLSTNAKGAQGQGIEMAVAAGAAVRDLDQIQIHPTVEANTGALITEGLRGDGAILVNANGERFFDEVGTRDAVSAAEIAQPGSYSWLVVDQKMLDASSVIAGYVTKGYTHQGDTYEALAEELGVDPETFANTMNTWNGYVAEKNDPDFGRVSFAQPLDTAPYYAVKVTAGIHHTMGGVVINSNAEVLDTEGNVIPGFFAAGEVTGGVHGGNRLGGNAVADFTIFGRIAGTSASEFASADLAEAA